MTTDREAERRRDFAAERGHNDAQAVNDHARAAVQTMIVINGGAATALLAFASTDNFMQRLLLGFGLLAFGIGVIAGALNIRRLTGATYNYMLAWDNEALEGHVSPDGQWFDEARRLKKSGDRLFTQGLVCFCIGLILAGSSIMFFPSQSRSTPVEQRR